MERSSEELYQMKDLKYAAESGNKKVILGKKKKKKRVGYWKVTFF